MHALSPLRYVSVLHRGFIVTYSHTHSSGRNAVLQNRSGRRLVRRLAGGGVFVTMLAIPALLEARDVWLVPHALAFVAGTNADRVRHAPPPARVSADSAIAVAAVARFHAALASGDSATALGLLATDAVIIESGDVQTRAEYRSHHLPADIIFAAAVPSIRTVTQVTISGDVAWITATSSTKGTYRDRPVNSVGAELTVLSRTSSGWQIRSVHWSSHAKRS